MGADQMSGAASLLLLAFLALVLVGAGLGIMMGAGGNKEKGGGMTPGKIAALVVVGFVLVVWLASPGTGTGLAALFNAMWGNVIIAVKPLIAIATQIAVIAVVLYVIYLFFRKRWK